MNRTLAVALVLAAAFAGGFVWHSTQRAAPVETVAAPPAPPGATLLEGMGRHPFKVTTASAEAQRWVDQGLMLAYGFNHDAAERSFLKATELDPECAMCWWGAALVLGPHVNAGMDPANAGKAWTRLQKAQALAAKATPREQAYIQALSARYAAEAPADRAPLDRAYAAAAGKLAQNHPDDLDAATLHAEALMDLQPWDYYDAQRAPTGNTAQFVQILEGVMARNPDHPGALHLYIHAVEASRDPSRGVAAADRLRQLVPGSGHLVHMPAHIYTRVGRFHDAALANRLAIAADDKYLATCRPGPGLYPIGYVPHNHHFLWWAASMEGDAASAIAAADETARRSNLPDMLRSPGFEALQDFMVTPLKARVQFGRWDEVAAAPRPADDLPYPVAIWEFAQGMAAVRARKSDLAAAHLEKLAAAAADPAIGKMFVGPKHSLDGTVKVAERLLAGELLAARGELDPAVEALEEAVAIEDRLNYFEPPLWHQPARLTLGAVLLESGRAAEAEKVFQADLERNPGNGWALWGLAQSLRAQHKDDAQAQAEFEKAWEHADAKLASSRL